MPWSGLCCHELRVVDRANGIARQQLPKSSGQLIAGAQGVVELFRIGGCVGQNPEHDECTHDPGHTEHGSDRVETIPHGRHNLSGSQSALHCLNADKEEHAAPRMRSIEEQRKEPP